MAGGGRTAPTPTVLLALEGMRVVLAVSGWDYANESYPAALN